MNTSRGRSDHFDSVISVHQIRYYLLLQASPEENSVRLVCRDLIDLGRACSSVKRARRGNTECRRADEKKWADVLDFHTAPL